MATSVVSAASSPSAMEFITTNVDVFLKAARSFQFQLGIDDLVYLDGGAHTHFCFDYFASWCIVFLVLYVLFALVWKVIPGTGLQSGKLPFIASSRCIGTVHCALVVPFSILALHRQNPDWFALEYLGINSRLEQRVMELSVGYFTADFVHFILFEPDVFMFIHHVFSISMMSSTGLVGRGGTCCMAALVQGEITNPFQSAFTVAKTAKATKLLAWLSPLFTFAFVIVRVPLVPFWTFGYINPSILWGPYAHTLPKALTWWWSIMSVIMAIGGWIWSYQLIRGLVKFYKNKAGVSPQKNKEGKKKQ